jgi:hypothetical protein
MWRECIKQVWEIARKVKGNEKTMEKTEKTR